jgi:hypothetical protein
VVLNLIGHAHTWTVECSVKIYVIANIEKRHLLLTCGHSAPLTDPAVCRFFIHGYVVGITYFCNLKCVSVDCGLTVEAIFIYFVAKYHCSN